MGIIANSYGYLTCFGKIDFARGHKWPCKGDDYWPWSKDAMVVEPVGAASIDRNLYPAYEFSAANTTAAVNASMVTIAVTPTP